jgi:(4S)-4-hydroxy-5-phosphonooxypentane-2,3-dione isomerase
MSRVVLVPRFTIKSDRMGEFMEHVLRQRDNCLAQESGCEHFDVLRCSETSSEILLYEIYTDQAAIKAHRQTPHYAEFKAATADLVEKLVLEVWEIVL